MEKLKEKKFRLSDEEIKKVEDYSKLMDISQAEFVRQCIRAIEIKNIDEVEEEEFLDDCDMVEDIMIELDNVIKIIREKEIRNCDYSNISVEIVKTLIEILYENYGEVIKENK